MPWIERPQFLWDANPNSDGDKPVQKWDKQKLLVESNDYEQTIRSLKARGAFIRHIRPPIPNKPSADMSSIGFSKDPNFEPDQDLGYAITCYVPLEIQGELL